MEKLSNNSGGIKKEYRKPQLRKIDLRPEEAVLGNCKTGNAAGPSPTCEPITGSCMTVGS